MKRLPKPFIQEFSASLEAASLALENARGDIFLALEHRDTPGVTHLFRWNENGEWAELCSLDGSTAGSSQYRQDYCCRLSFDAAGQEALVLALRSGEGLDLVRMDYDGRVLSHTPVSQQGRELSWVSAFPDGDFLLYGKTWGTPPDDFGAYFAERIAQDGATRWTHRRRVPSQVDTDCVPPARVIGWNGALDRALALSDDSTLLLVRDAEDTQSCHMEFLDQSGELIRQSSDRWGLWPTVTAHEGGWVVEDIAPVPSESVFPPRYRCGRVHFDRQWREQRRQEVTLQTFNALIGHSMTFLEQGVLAGSCHVVPPCRMLWAPFGGEARIIYDSQTLSKDLSHADISIPPMRREDGSYLFTMSGANANARFTVAGVSPGGETLWAKKFRCEGKRWAFLRGERMVMVLCSFDATRAETYQLPS